MNQAKITPKDFFLHLGATVALYASAIAIINLAFSIIDYFFPDVLAGGFYVNSMAWPISMLIILVPILYILEWLINKDIKQVPEKGDLWIRKWRIYLTLFLVIVLIGGDLIVLINIYLNGEVSSRFVYKILAILLVGGSIGKYYFFNLYTNFKISKFVQRFKAWSGIVLVLAAIITGFIVVGSPAKQRAVRFDSQRINDLRNIQWQVVSYWQQKSKLPSNLEELRDPISDYSIPTDPETHKSYEYSIKDIKTFKLCADFSLDYQDLKDRGEPVYVMNKYMMDASYPAIGIDDNWVHKIGHTCFERTIDPEKYPSLKKGI